MSCGEPSRGVVPEPSEDEVINATLREALSLLGMDMAFLGRYVYGYEEFRGLAGDAEQFGLSEGFRLPFTQTLCRQMSMGRVPNIIPDVSTESALADLPLVKDGTIQSYAGVPVVAPDGTEYGALCCLSAQPEPHLTEEHLRRLQELADALGEHLSGHGPAEPKPD